MRTLVVSIPLLSILFSLTRTQPSQQFYTFGFGVQGDWIYDSGSFNIGTYSQCQTDQCLVMSGAAKATLSLSTVGYHTVEIILDLAESNLDHNEYCWLSYSPNPSASDINSNCAITLWTGSSPNCQIMLPDDTNYNNNPQVQIILNSNADFTAEYCFWDNFRVSGIPYTHSPSANPTPIPTTNPTPSPTNNPTPSPTNNPTNNPTSDPTFVPTNVPTNDPTLDPSTEPTKDPSFTPSFNPSRSPTPKPILMFEYEPSKSPNTKWNSNAQTTNQNDLNDSKYDTNNSKSTVVSTSVIVVAMVIILFLAVIGSTLVFVLFCKRREKKVITIVVSKSECSNALPDTNIEENDRYSIGEIEMNDMNTLKIFGSAQSAQTESRKIDKNANRFILSNNNEQHLVVSDVINDFEVIGDDEQLTKQGVNDIKNQFEINELPINDDLEKFMDNKGGGTFIIKNNGAYIVENLSDSDDEILDVLDTAQ